MIMRRIAGIMLVIGLAVLAFGLVKAIPLFFADPLTTVSAGHLHAGHVPSKNVIITGGKLRGVSITAANVEYVPLIPEGWREGPIKLVVRRTRHDQRVGDTYRGTLAPGVDAKVRSRFAEAGVEIDQQAWLLDLGHDPTKARDLGLVIAAAGLISALLGFGLSRKAR
jgi:hypothetical protein